MRKSNSLIVVPIALLSGLLAGCSSAPSTPLVYFQGKWSCTDNQTPEVKGAPLDKWSFDISQKRITMSPPHGSEQEVENYVLKGGTLTLTDNGNSGRLQQSYKDPATAKFPKAIPANGNTYDTAIQLPNGDTWVLKITVNGDKATIKVAEPEDELWACARS